MCGLQTTNENTKGGFIMSKYTNDLPVYHTRNGIVSIMWCLHRSIEEKHFMTQEGLK